MPKLVRSPTKAETHTNMNVLQQAYSTLVAITYLRLT